MKYIDKLLMLLFPVLWIGCFDDKGNYEYSALSEITVANLKENYTAVSSVDVLHIDPQISSSNPNDRLSCIWTLNRHVNESLGQTADIDTIGEETVLDFPVNVKRGEYDLGLWVTNESNGNATYHEAILTVTTNFSNGFYVLKEINGTTELDLHLPDGSVSQNLIEEAVGEKWNDRPVSLGITPMGSYMDEATGGFLWTSMLNVCTENDVRVFNIEDMSIVRDHSTMFYGEIPEEKPYYLWYNMFGVAYMSNLGIYYSMQSYDWSPSSGQYGYPDRSGEYIPNKLSVFDGSGYYFFDELNGRFMQMDASGYVTDLGTEGEVPNEGIDDKLLYFGRRYETDYSGFGYAIFEDAENAQQRYLYSLKFDYGNFDNPITELLAIPIEMAFASADLYAVSELASNVIFFSKDNQLYRYSLSSHTEEIIPVEGLGAGEKIMYLHNAYWQSEDSEEAFDYLVIGTYTEGNYKLYLYNMLGGYTDGMPQRILEGEGMPVKMRYVSQNMENDDYVLYPVSF